jgi:hypothetical protein
MKYLISDSGDEARRWVRPTNVLEATDGFYLPSGRSLFIIGRLHWIGIVPAEQGCDEGACNAMGEGIRI